MTKIFVSHKNHVEPDDTLANYFVNALTAQEYSVFIDQFLEIGDKWPLVIQQELDSADFFLLLLSDEAATSEMVIEEVRMAYKRNRQEGRPLILPIRIHSNNPLPYDLAAMLDRIQYAAWTKSGAETSILEQIVGAISKYSSFEAPENVTQDPVVVTDSTATVPTGLQILPPLPVARLPKLTSWEIPGGAMKLESPFYVARPADSEAYEVVGRDGETIKVKGCRQMGKTSLLVRVRDHALTHQHPVLFIDFQMLDKEQLRDLDTLLYVIGTWIAEEFKTNQSPDAYWSSKLGAKDKLTRFMNAEVLGHSEKSVVLILDEVDRIFHFQDYRDDFFGLIRAWHNRRAMSPIWKRLNIVLSYATEAALFIQDLNQSPFNVGLDLALEDFDSSQVLSLNELHDSPLKTQSEMEELMGLVGGHPYLLRKSLYEMVAHKMPLRELKVRALNDDGPFADHLRHYLFWLESHPEFQVAMKTALHEKMIANDIDFYRLQSAGLVRGADRTFVLPRCGLYAQYFRKHL